MCCQSLKGINGISLGLAHLLSVLVQYKTHNNYIFIRRLVKEQGGLCKKGVEPASSLIHSLGNELSRELRLKKLFILKRIMMLCKGHGS